MENPYFIDWAVTERCNLACDHCTGMLPGDLSGREALALVDQIAELRPGWVIVEGGEALLRPDIMEILGALRSHDLLVHLITNAMLLDEERSRRLRDLGVRVLVSLDGADRETHERLKTGADWEKVIANARRAGELGALWGITVVLCRSNLAQLAQLASLAGSLGAQRMVVIGLEPTADVAHFSREGLTIDDYRRAVREVVRLQEEGPAEIFFDEPFFEPAARALGLGPAPEGAASGIRVEGVPGCIWGDYIYIQSNGDVRPCMFAQAQFAVGNVKERRLGELWRALQDSPLRADLRERSRRHGPCASCAHFSGCGGCVARIFGITGDPLASDPLCPLASLPVAAATETSS